MMNRRAIYLAGPISGLSVAESRGWRDEFARQFMDQSHNYGSSDVRILDPLRNVRPLLPDMDTWGESAWPATIDHGMLRDLHDIDASDVVVFAGLDTAKKVSIGSMIEWGYARAKGKKILRVMNYNNRIGSPHNHPWLDTSDFTVPDIKAAVDVLVWFFGLYELPARPYGDAKHGDAVQIAEPRTAQPGPVPTHFVGARVVGIRLDSEATRLDVHDAAHRVVTFPSARGASGHAQSGPRHEEDLTEKYSKPDARSSAEAKSTPGSDSD